MPSSAPHLFQSSLATRKELMITNRAAESLACELEWGRHNQSWVHLSQANELIGGRAWFFQACLAPKFILFPLLLFSQSGLKQCSLETQPWLQWDPRVRDFVKLGLSWAPTSSFMKRWQGCERAFGGNRILCLWHEVASDKSLRSLLLRHPLCTQITGGLIKRQLLLPFS